MTTHIKYPMALIALLSMLLLTFSTAQAEQEISVEPAQQQDDLLDDAELRELVGPVALYPDELLAIVLPASTYPLQIVAAARYREAAKTDKNLEPDEYWDESVVALLNYPEALDFLNEDLDWTWELGQAVTSQQEDVLAAVRTFREEAVAAGNLDSDDRQVVTVEDDVVTITSSDPEVVHVPYYEPEEVTVYQTQRVYHYYPQSYPLYYYPYDYSHSYYGYNYGFWGISSVFVLSWSDYHLGYYPHSYRYHPYYGRTYHHNHFRRTHVYVSPRSYQRRHHYDQRPRDVWRPNHRYAGARPNHRQYDNRVRQERHVKRSPVEAIRYAKYRERARQNQGNIERSSVHRAPEREINSVRQTGERSTVHRPRQKHQQRQHEQLSRQYKQQRQHNQQPRSSRETQAQAPARQYREAKRVPLKVERQRPQGVQQTRERPAVRERQQVAQRPQRERQQVTQRPQRENPQQAYAAPNQQRQVTTQRAKKLPRDRQAIGQRKSQNHGERGQQQQHRSGFRLHNQK